MEECATFSDVIVAACNILLLPGLNKLWILLWLHSVAAITIISRSELIISTTDSFTTPYNDFPMQISGFATLIAVQSPSSCFETLFIHVKWLIKLIAVWKNSLLSYLGLRKFIPIPKPVKFLEKPWHTFWNEKTQAYHCYLYWKSNLPAIFKTATGFVFIENSCFKVKFVEE